ncbi:MAG: hypothetical protein M1469_07405 [Bacteroidetes bacterium]|nr:hypothetical protein [Bacteroidota bacterium]
MIAVLLAACIMNGKTGTDTLSTKKLAGEYKMFYDPPAVLISPQGNQLPDFIPVPFLLNGVNRWRNEQNVPASGAKDSSANVKRLHDGLRQKK